MLHALKKRLYFIVAWYFAFWAKIVLHRWQPRIVVVTGSSGKTTLLHLIEAQLRDEAIYTHHANSAIGIPFHILGLPTNVESPLLWISQLLKAPFKAWRKVPKTKLYVVEADNDRPNEGKFLAKLLKPEATLWVSVHRTHSMNFDALVRAGKFKTHEDAIAYEFGHFIAHTDKLAIIDVDIPQVRAQLDRVPKSVKIEETSLKNLIEFKIGREETIYKINGQTIRIPGLHSKEMAISLQMVKALLEHLNKPLKPNFNNLEMPPSRSSVFDGKKKITIIDSSYNTGLGAMTAMLKLFNDYPAEHKWAVLGDILEQGGVEEEEHQKLAEVVNSMKLERVIFLGPRTHKYTLPIVVKKQSRIPVVSFDNPKEVLDYLNQNLEGGEAVFFKGGRYLEGVIEQLLDNPADAAKLARRGPKWTKIRQKWGLPS